MAGVKYLGETVRKGIAILMLALSPASIADFGVALEAAALDRTKYQVRYDGSYMAIDYPGGDVPGNIGVCTDVVIRSYRAIGTDLQVLVHEEGPVCPVALNSLPVRVLYLAVTPLQRLLLHHCDRSYCHAPRV